jgi:hypothetical protein
VISLPQTIFHFLLPHTVGFRNFSPSKEELQADQQETGDRPTVRAVSLSGPPTAYLQTVPFKNCKVGLFAAPRLLKNIYISSERNTVGEDNKFKALKGWSSMHFCLYQLE